MKVDDIAKQLESGTLLPSDVKIDVVVRQQQTYILNTRSSVALLKAGIPKSAWTIVNRTGQDLFENNLTNQLLKK